MSGRRGLRSAASAFLTRVLSVLGSGAGVDSLRQWSIDPISDTRKAPMASPGQRGWLRAEYPGSQLPLELP